MVSILHLIFRERNGVELRENLVFRIVFVFRSTLRLLFHRNCRGIGSLSMTERSDNTKVLGLERFLHVIPMYQMTRKRRIQ